MTRSKSNQIKPIIKRNFWNFKNFILSNREIDFMENQVECKKCKKKSKVAKPQMVMCEISIPQSFNLDLQPFTWIFYLSYKVLFWVWNQWKYREINSRYLRERGMASTPKMEYQVFLIIFQKNSALGTLGLK